MMDPPLPHWCYCRRPTGESGLMWGDEPPPSTCTHTHTMVWRPCSKSYPYFSCPNGVIRGFMGSLNSHPCPVVIRWPLPHCINKGCDESEFLLLCSSNEVVPSFTCWYKVRGGLLKRDLNKIQILII